MPMGHGLTAATSPPVPLPLLLAHVAPTEALAVLLQRLIPTSLLLPPLCRLSLLPFDFLPPFLPFHQVSLLGIAHLISVGWLWSVGAAAPAAVPTAAYF